MEPIEGSAVTIYCDNKANTDALRAILDQDGIRDLPLVVIPVAGEFRGGKSFLLSYFIRYLTKQNFGENYEKLEGFEFKKSDEAVTQGIIIWNKPLIVKLPGKEKILVLLMDSQGILGGEEDNKQASRVFALSTMLSSIMIFNLKGQINDGVLNYLQLFTSYGCVATAENGDEVDGENAKDTSAENGQEVDGENDKDTTAENGQEVDGENAKDTGAENGQEVNESRKRHGCHGSIKVKRRRKEVNDKNANKASVENGHEMPFQKLMILIRDWQNTDVYGFEGGKQYLDKYYKKHKNVFGNYFRDISCYLMPHPGKSLPKEGSTGCLNDLDEDFQQCMKELITGLCNPGYLAKHVKNVVGSILTAGQFCDFFENCVKRISTENYENLSCNPVEMKADCMCKLATKEAVKLYTSYIEKKTNAFLKVTESSHMQLEVFHKDALKEAIIRYDELAVYAKRHDRQTYISNATQRNMELDEKYATYREHLRRRMLQQSIDTLEDAIRSIELISTTLENIKDNMSNVQTGVRSVKWVSAVVGAGSAVLCFTPFAPVAIAGLGAASLGAAGLGASGTTAAGASVVDFGLTTYAVKRIAEYAKEADTCLKQCQVVLEAAIQMHLAVGSTGAIGAAIGVGTSMIVKDLADDVIAFALSNQGYTVILNNMHMVVATVGAAMSVIGAVTTQLQENTSISNARNLKVKIEEMIIDMKKQTELMNSFL